MTDSPTLISGPMFAGKTTELIRRAKAAAKRGRLVCVVAFKGDDRYGGGIASHDGVRLEPSGGLDVRILGPDELMVLPRHDDVFIDEGQFFPCLLAASSRLLKMGATVTISCLDLDFRRVAFPAVQQVMDAFKCENVKVTGVCFECGAPSVYTKRTSAETDLFVIAGADKYKPVCGSCY